MKKVLLLLACAMTLGACSKDPENTDPYGYKQIGAMLYLGAMNQLGYNLDPFSIAFRVNTLMVECEKAGLPLDDLDNAPHKADLLGSTTISNSGQGGYKLSLSGKGGEKDNLRTGTIYINTNGKPLKDGNSWEVILPKEEPYTVSISGYLASVTATGYTITAQADNSWKVWLSSLVSKPSSDAGVSNGNPEGSNWSGSFKITQVDNPGDQTLQGISTSPFKVDITEANGVTTAYFTNKLNIGTGTPLTYTPACGTTVTSGTLSVAFTESEDLLNFAFCKWIPGEEACKPTIELDYHGTSIDVAN